MSTPCGTGASTTNSGIIETGNGYSDPPQDHESAVLALDLGTGAVKWAFQPMKGDVWLIGCPSQTAGDNCPAVSGPDFDFGSSPILTTAHRSPSPHLLSRPLRRY